jgi:hypothetical protein
MEKVTLEEQAQGLADLYILAAEFAADTVLGEAKPDDDDNKFARIAFKLGYIHRCQEQLR